MTIKIIIMAIRSHSTMLYAYTRIQVTLGAGLPTTMHSNLTVSPIEALTSRNVSTNMGFSNFSSKSTSSVDGLTASSNVVMALTMTCEKHLASPALFTALTVYWPLSEARALCMWRMAVPSSSELIYRGAHIVRLSNTANKYYYDIRLLQSTTVILWSGLISTVFLIHLKSGLGQPSALHSRVIESPSLTNTSDNSLVNFGDTTSSSISGAEIECGLKHILLTMSPCVNDYIINHISRRYKVYAAPGLGSTFNELLLLASPAEFMATTLYSPASSMNASLITSEHWSPWNKSWMSFDSLTGLPSWYQITYVIIKSKTLKHTQLYFCFYYYLFLKYFKSYLYVYSLLVRVVRQSRNSNEHYRPRWLFGLLTATVSTVWSVPDHSRFRNQMSRLAICLSPTLGSCSTLRRVQFW